MHGAYRLPSGTARPRRPRRRAPVLCRLPALLVALVTWACGSYGSEPAPEALIDREVFIDAYVDLRVAALRTDSQRIAHEDRSEILDRHGITEQHLLDFAETNADRLEFMRDVWNEVELRLDAESMSEEVR